MEREFTNELEVLIRNYVACAKYSCSLLKEMYTGKETFLRAKVLKKIPKEGVIENVFFKFHGSGCYFEYPDHHIDLDFGPNNRCDGFDLPRLKDFFSGMKNRDRYSFLSLGEDQFSILFEQLIMSKVIFNPELEPNPHLYYFK